MKYIKNNQIFNIVKNENDKSTSNILVNNIQRQNTYEQYDKIKVAEILMPPD